MSDRTLRLAYWSVVLLLFLPMAMLIATSFKANAIVGFPLGVPSLRWYLALGDDDAVWRALSWSLAIALVSAVLATLMGVWTALVSDGWRSRWGRDVLLAGALVPLFTPGLIHAISLRIAINSVGLAPGVASVILAHAIHAMPYGVILAVARLRTQPHDWMEAARELGATRLQAFRLITLPWLSPSILGAFLLALLTSFDDFVRSFFLGDDRSTLPVLIYGRLHGGLSPELNAIATCVLLVAVAFGAVRVPTDQPTSRA